MNGNNLGIISFTYVGDASTSNGFLFSLWGGGTLLTVSPAGSSFSTSLACAAVTATSIQAPIGTVTPNTGAFTTTAATQLIVSASSPTQAFPINAYQPSLGNNQTTSMLLGVTVSGTAGNMGEITYNYVGLNSPGNSLGLGFYGAANRMTVTPAGDVAALRDVYARRSIITEHPSIGYYFSNGPATVPAGTVLVLSATGLSIDGSTNTAYGQTLITLNTTSNTFDNISGRSLFVAIKQVPFL